MSRIIVLGLLSKHPMHGYEIQQILQKERVDLWTNLLPNSIYHALRQMDKEGLIKVHSKEERGHRVRVIYEITEAGKKEFKILLKEALKTPSRKFPSSLYTSLSFLNEITEDEVSAAIQNHIDDLEKDIIAWRHGEEKKIEYSEAPNILKAIFSNGIEHMESDLRLLYYIKDHIKELRYIAEEYSSKGEL
ncbi:MAG: PadR family transcriptional regulator [Maledivibacter sp.]|jgi:DNA-binding PadR family transcriptional regulator|nr:PadR family transcriptional regulator [Maledivibacter sp.]